MRVAVVTGVSRRQGIGFAIAQRLLADGLSVVIHSWAAHDVEQAWSPGADELSTVIKGLGGLGYRLDHIEADFSAPDAPPRLIDHAVDRFGGDVPVANHAMSAPGRLEEVTAEQWTRRGQSTPARRSCWFRPRENGTMTPVRTDGCCCSPQDSTSGRWSTSCPARSARAPFIR